MVVNFLFHFTVAFNFTTNLFINCNIKCRAKIGSINNSVYQKFCNPSWQAIFSFQSLQNVNPKSLLILYIVASFVKFYT